MSIILQERLRGGGIISIWDMHEDMGELMEKGGHLIGREWEAIRAENRKKEWLSSRLLLENLLKEVGESLDSFAKNEDNKPYISTLPEAGISVSHTKGISVAIFHPFKQVGIDVEYQSPRVSRIADKFLHPEERAVVGEDWRLMLKYWCAKEALYKLQGKKGAFFKEELRVYAPLQKDGWTGEVNRKEGSFAADLGAVELSEHLIVYALEQ